MKDSRLYLVHVQDCIARIRDYTQGGKTEFMQNGLVQDAVLRNLEVMGESVKKLPDAWKQRQPQVEWLKVGDFRNVLAHDYLDHDRHDARAFPQPLRSGGLPVHETNVEGAGHTPDH